MWNELLAKSLPKLMVAKLTASAESAIEKVCDQPVVDVAVERMAALTAERFGVEVLGIPAKRRYPTVYDFFDDYLRPAYEVASMSQKQAWCARWWAHRAVVFRVTAMWRAYEHLALTDPLRADEQFLRFVGDHHMRVLLGEDSPMKGCKSGHQRSGILSSETMGETNGQAAA